MINPRLKDLESAIVARQPIFSEKLQLGLTEARIRKKLSRIGAKGNVEALVELYRWKNGTLLDWQFGTAYAGFFPGDIYYFTDLDEAIGYFDYFREAKESNPEDERFSAFVGRYFPILWNGAGKWIAVDLNPSTDNQVVIIEFDAAQPLRKAYQSFQDFLADLVRANKENLSLVCFQKE